MLDLNLRQYKHEDKKEVFMLHRFVLKTAIKNYRGGKWENDLHTIEESYINSGGEFLVGLLNNKIVIMGALKKVDNEIAKLEMLRVHPKFQRQGLGQFMLDLLEDTARKLGFKKINLDTTFVQVAAQKLYLKNGYVEIDRKESKSFDGGDIFYSKLL